MAGAKRGETLVALLRSVAVSCADELALIERDGDGFTTMTFSGLASAAADLAGELGALDVGRGDVVGVWLPNWRELVVWEFALASLGAAMLGINTRYGVHELTHLIARGRPVGVVVPSRFLELDFAGRLSEAVASADLEAPPWVAVVRGADGEEGPFDVGGGSWVPAPLADHGPVQIDDAGDPSDAVNYFTTSGSTGMPKLAGHDQRGVAAHSRNVAAAMDMQPGDRVLAGLPLCGVFGFNAAMAMLAAGGGCLLEPVFDSELVLSDMDEHGVTHAIGGDDMLGRMMDSWLKVDAGARPRLARLRRGAVADFAGRPRAVAEWAEREFGARISGVYGASELFALTSIWPSELQLRERERAGGRLISAEIQVRVVDPESGEACAPEVVGELQFRGYNVVSGYLGDQEALRKAFTADGWFQSGDLGFALTRSDEFVYVCRAGDALRLRGFLVEPAEIEQFLCSRPGVSMAKVVGAAAGDGGEVAVAYVQLEDGAGVTGEELRAVCRERLAPFKVPAYINVIDEFPVTTGTNGTKIRTAELRRWAAEQLASDQR